jgi:hypothetical protein
MSSVGLAKTTAEEITLDCLNKVGHVSVCKQSMKPSIFYSHIDIAFEFMISSSNLSCFSNN